MALETDKPPVGSLEDKLGDLLAEVDHAPASHRNVNVWSRRLACGVDATRRGYLGHIDHSSCNNVPAAVDKVCAPVPKSCGPQA